MNLTPDQTQAIVTTIEFLPLVAIVWIVSHYGSK